MGELQLTKERVDYLADCLLNNRPIDLPDRGYWGRDTLFALAGAALAILRNSNEWVFADVAGKAGLPAGTFGNGQRDAISADAELVSAMIADHWGVTSFVLVEPRRELDDYIEPVKGVRRLM